MSRRKRNLLKLATATTVTSNYAGTAAGSIIGAAFKEGDTLGRNLITFLPNVGFKHSLRLLDYTESLVNYASGFTPLGAVDLNERLITPKKIKMDLELFKEDFRVQWSEETMGAAARNDQLPPDVQDAIMAEILASLAQTVDRDIWQGLLANTGEVPGFIEKFDADANVIKANSGIAALGAPVSKANVVQALENLTTAIPIALRRKPDLILAVGPDVANFYSQSLINPQITNGLGGEALTIQYGIHTLEIINGLPENTLLVYQKANLNMASGLLDDMNTVIVSDVSQVLLDGNIRFKVVFSGDTQYARSEEVVFYDTTVV